jgi:hypothetical protein
MLSVANILEEVGIPISSYKITELVDIVFRLTQISGSILEGDSAKMVIDDEEDVDEEEEEEVGKEETEYTDPLFDMEGCRAGWESVWGSRMGRCGGFKDTSKHAAYLTQLIILLPSLIIHAYLRQIIFLYKGIEQRDLLNVI